MKHSFPYFQGSLEIGEGSLEVGKYTHSEGPKLHFIMKNNFIALWDQLVSACSFDQAHLLSQYGIGDKRKL